MPAASPVFPAFVVAQRTRHLQRLRVAVLLSILIAALLYQTTWLALRPGLVLLLAGQLGVALAFAFRIRAFTSTLATEDCQPTNAHDTSVWFTSEEAFLRRLTFGEGLAQLLGFALLGYEFWTATGSVGLALAIGLLYPLAMYFGITRRRNATNLRQLLAKKQEIAP